MIAGTGAAKLMKKWIQEEFAHISQSWKQGALDLNEEEQRIRRELQIYEFNGTNSSDWIVEMEEFFLFFQLNEEEKLKVATMGINKDARWWLGWEYWQQPFFMWEDLKGLVVHRFQSVTTQSIPNEKPPTRSEDEKGVMEVHLDPGGAFGGQQTSSRGAATVQERLEVAAVSNLVENKGGNVYRGRIRGGSGSGGGLSGLANLHDGEREGLGKEQTSSKYNGGEQIFGFASGFTGGGGQIIGDAEDSEIGGGQEGCYKGQHGFTAEVSRNFTESQGNVGKYIKGGSGASGSGGPGGVGDGGRMREIGEKKGFDGVKYGDAVMNGGVFMLIHFNEGGFLSFVSGCTDGSSNVTAKELSDGDGGCGGVEMGKGAADQRPGDFASGYTGGGGGVWDRKFKIGGEGSSGSGGGPGAVMVVE